MSHAHLENTYTIRQNPTQLFTVDLKFKFDRCSVMFAESGNPTLRSQSRSPCQTPALPLPRLSSLPMQGHEEPQTTSKKTNPPQTGPSEAAPSCTDIHAREEGNRPPCPPRAVRGPPQRCWHKARTRGQNWGTLCSSIFLGLEPIPELFSLLCTQEKVLCQSKHTPSKQKIKPQQIF